MLSTVGRTGSCVREGFSDPPRRQKLEEFPALWHQLHKSGTAVVIHVDLAPHPGREVAARAWLDEREQARRHRFLNARPRREFTLCRAALRALLCRRLACRNDELAFGTSNYGKPYALVGGRPVPTTFNVSHSGRHGLIAIASEGRIGVDVEEHSIRRDLAGDIGMLFAPGERAALEAANAIRRTELFFSLWTLKEALLKAVGTGLSLDTARFEIPSALYRGTRRSVFRFSETPSVAWRLERLGNTRFAAALAHELVPTCGPDAGPYEAVACSRSG